MKIDQLFGVAGKVAAITGGASGFGLAAARALATNGANVTIIDVNADSLADAARELAGEGLTVATAVADVTDKAAIEAAIAGVVSRNGRLDVLFANAGISGGPGFSENRWNAKSRYADRETIERALGKGLGHQRHGDRENGPVGSAAHEKAG